MKLIKHSLKNDVDLTIEEMRHVWYISYGMVYLLSVVLVGFLHKLSSLPLSKYSKLAALSFLLLGLTVWVKYVLRVHLDIDSEVIRYVYGLIINITKIYLAVATLTIALYALWIFVNNSLLSHSLSNNNKRKEF